MSTRSVRRIFFAGIFALTIAGAPSVVFAAGNDAVLKAAQADVGKRMWSGYGLPNGKLGCAAALSNVLKQAGYKQAHSAVVRVVYNQLGTISGITRFKLSGGGEVTTAEVLERQTKPGDVLLAFSEPPTKANLGPNAHCGIVGPDGQMYTNDWNDGIWKLTEFQRYFYWYKYLYIFRLP